MGALVEGYEAARKRRDEQIAERHRKEELADHELHELDGLISQDADFLAKNGIAHEVVNRTMRLAYQRSPVVTVHYSAEEKLYEMTIMHDGSRFNSTNAAECAKAIGEALFAVLAKQGRPE
jgi:hypothetical protein